jgi:tripartite-type tricarboxylate transporter receptor subunit TctC
MNTMKLYVGAFILVAAVSLAMPSQAQPSVRSWPQRTVKFLVPLGPSSGADITARLLADQLTKRWGQAVVVENRPGADGIVALTAFLANPDDHTLLFTPTGTFTTHPFFHDTLTYKPGDLVPVARVTNTVVSVAVPVARKLQTIADLIMLARSRPGQLNWASVTGSTDLIFSGFLKAEGLTMARVPYRDNVQAVNDLVEGRIEVFLSALVSVRSQVNAGKVKMLAVTNSERAPVVPDFPTVREAGYPALQFDGLVGLFAAPGMPVDVRMRIASDTLAVTADPAFAERVAATGQVVSPGTAAEFAASIEEQRAKFAAIARTLGGNPRR